MIRNENVRATFSLSEQGVSIGLPSDITPAQAAAVLSSFFGAEWFAELQAVDVPDSGRPDSADDDRKEKRA